MTAKGNLLSDIIQKELAEIGSFRRAISADGNLGRLNELSQSLTNLEHSLREQMQEETRDEMEGIIRSLERGDDPSLRDKELIRAWMIGDAEAYLETENNFDDWTAELSRLVDTIASARGRKLSPAQMTRLQAMVRDALRTAADIHYYQEQKARVGRFRDATADWSPDDKEALAVMLRSKLESHEG